jgi:hypothetical protein
VGEKVNVVLVRVVRRIGELAALDPLYHVNVFVRETDLALGKRVDDGATVVRIVHLGEELV